MRECWASIMISAKCPVRESSVVDSHDDIGETDDAEEVRGTYGTREE